MSLCICKEFFHSSFAIIIWNKSYLSSTQLSDTLFMFSALLRSFFFNPRCIYLFFRGFSFLQSRVEGCSACCGFFVWFVSRLVFWWKFLRIIVSGKQVKKKDRKIERFLPVSFEIYLCLLLVLIVKLLISWRVRGKIWALSRRIVWVSQGARRAPFCALKLRNFGRNQCSAISVSWMVTW